MVMTLEARRLLKDKFCVDVTNLVGEPRALVVAVENSTGAIEMITNYEDLGNKITYYMTQYDDCFRSRTNSKVKIIGYLLV